MLAMMLLNGIPKSCTATFNSTQVEAKIFLFGAPPNHNRHSRMVLSTDLSNLYPMRTSEDSSTCSSPMSGSMRQKWVNDFIVWAHLSCHFLFRPAWKNQSSRERKRQQQPNQTTSDWPHLIASESEMGRAQNGKTTKRNQRESFATKVRAQFVLI